MRSTAVALLLVFTTACTHTVTVLVPVADVPEGTHVRAAVTPGAVTQLPPDAKLGVRGAVSSDKKLLMNLSPTDEVAVEASGGETFGRIEVVRKPGYDAIMVLGILVLLGGITTSFALAGSCNSNYSTLQGPCAAIAATGGSASLAGGLALVVYGLHGELVVKPTGVVAKF